MYQITKLDLANMRMRNNTVLLKIKMFNDLIKFKDGTEIELNTDFNPQYHLTATGEVIKVPENILTDRKKYLSMEWDTDIEIRPGDIAYLDYLEILKALGTKADRAASYPMEMWFTLEDYKETGDVYIMVKYQYIHFVLRQDNIIMCNGYVMAQEVEVELTSEVIEIVSNVTKGHKSGKWAIILESGSLIRNHRDGYKDKDYIGKGDLVLCTPIAKEFTERELHQTIHKGKKYFVMQRHWIKAYVNAQYADQYLKKIYSKELV